jgi:ubiquitin-protein ligase
MPLECSGCDEQTNFRVSSTLSLCSLIMSCLVWYGVLFIHHGIYEEGVFKFIMTIPENYPDGDCPVSDNLPFE